MSQGVNKAILIGNAGADPEIRHTHNGAVVANLRIATTDTWTDRETKERNERTEWHRVVYFGAPAKIVDQYVRKGQQLYVEGRIQTRKWQDQEGNDRYTTEIVGNQIRLLGRAPQAHTQGQGDPYSGPSEAARTPQQGDPPPTDRGPSDDFDDDIPF